MTLRRSNPGTRPGVIDRNDDSASQIVHLAVVGEHGVFLDVLIDALRDKGVDAWRVDPGTTNGPRDHLRLRGVDLILLDLRRSGYTDRARALVRRFVGNDMLVVVLDRDVDPPPGQTVVEAGALWAINPQSVNIEELVAVFRRAAVNRKTAEHERGRAERAGRAWAEAIGAESSILTMRGGFVRGEDDPSRNARRSLSDTSVVGGLTGGEQGRQV